MIVTELMAGGSLQELLTGPRPRRLSCFRATQMAADMARALFYLHRRSPKVSDSGIRVPPFLGQWLVVGCMPVTPLAPSLIAGSVFPGCSCHFIHAHAHTLQPTTHGELKPSNVLLGCNRMFTSYHKRVMEEETGVLKIADFGLARSTKGLLQPDGDEDGGLASVKG